MHDVSKDAIDDRRGRFESAAVVHMRLLYRTALHLTGSADDASDLVQDTFLRAYRAFDQFTPGTNCKAWLFTIMYSVFNSRYRKVQRELDGMRVMALEAQYQQWLVESETSADPAEVVRIQAWAEPEVRRALEQLPDEFRSATLLVDVGELSYEEAAVALGCPVGTVRSRLFRARKLLYAALRTYAGEQGYAVGEERT